MRFAIALLTLVSLAACADEPTVAATTQAVTSSAEPVKLLDAEMEFDCDFVSGVCNDARYRIVALVEVQNLAFDKTVALFGTWAFRSGAWDNIGFGEYVAPAGAGAEYWRVTTPWRAGSPRGQTATFVVRYDAAGQSYWDNNSSADFCLTQGRGPCSSQVLGAANIAVSDTFTQPGSFGVLLTLKNLAFDKVVRVVYTTDGWATVNEGFASYGFSLGPDLERWVFDADVPADADEVEFAVEYQVLGQSFWDNNGTDNYVVSLVRPLP